MDEEKAHDAWSLFALGLLCLCLISGALAGCAADAKGSLKDFSQGNSGKK